MKYKVNQDKSKKEIEVTVLRKDFEQVYNIDYNNK